MQIILGVILGHMVMRKLIVKIKYILIYQTLNFLINHQQMITFLQ